MNGFDVARFQLLFVIFLVFFFDILVFFVVLFIFVSFVLIFLFLVFLEVIGNGIEVNGVCLGNFQFSFTFWATQDFALLYFVLIHVNFGATIGAANHGTTLRTILAQGL